jgi:hypothetical protein
MTTVRSPSPQPSPVGARATPGRRRVALPAQRERGLSPSPPGGLRGRGFGSGLAQGRGRADPPFVEIVPLFPAGGSRRSRAPSEQDSRRRSDATKNFQKNFLHLVPPGVALRPQPLSRLGALINRKSCVILYSRGLRKEAAAGPSHSWLGGRRVLSTPSSGPTMKSRVRPGGHGLAGGLPAPL